MTARTPLVVGGDGLPQQLQSGDSLSLYESFAQSRWLHCDFDGLNAGGVANGAISSGTYSAIVDGANTYGVVQMSSSTTASSGYYLGWVTGQTYVTTGNIFRTIFNLPAAQSTRSVRLGWQNSANAATPSSGAWLSISDATVQASFASVAESHTQGSAILSYGIYLVADIEVTSATSVRYVIWDLLAGTKYFDQTITLTNNIATNVNNSPIGWALSLATSSGTSAIALMKLDYIGRGVARPAAIVTPN